MRDSRASHRSQTSESRSTEPHAPPAARRGGHPNRVDSAPELTVDFARRHERVRAEVDVHLWVNQEVYDQDARTANLSEDGMFVVTSQPLPVGTKMRFEMKLPRSPMPQDTPPSSASADREPGGFDQVAGFAEVMWIRARFENAERPNGMGVGFIAVRGDGKLRLRDFVSRTFFDPHSVRATVHEQEL